MIKIILWYISFLREYLFKNTNVKGNSKIIIDAIIEILQWREFDNGKLVIY